MKNNLNDKPDTQLCAEEISAPQKLAYSSPVLQVFGSVNKLTNGNGTASFDGNSKNGQY